jgi:hypothetical protein
MEEILWLYSLPYDPDYPVYCVDERPCFLVGDLVEPLAMQPGQLKKEHYADEKLGSCALLVAIEPLTGRRLAQVHAQRTMQEFTCFCKALAEANPDAKKIRLVLDKLNTHKPAAFYYYRPADEARALAQRFEFYYTPKSASWLNMIEIEFSALARLCLKRHIATQERLATEVLALVTERHEKRITFYWQFSIDKTQTKFHSHYTKVYSGNEKYQKT